MLTYVFSRLDLRGAVFNGFDDPRGDVVSGKI